MARHYESYDISGVIDINLFSKDDVTTTFLPLTLRCKDAETLLSVIESYEKNGWVRNSFIEKDLAGRWTITMIKKEKKA